MEGGLRAKRERLVHLLAELDASYSAVEQLARPGELQYDFELGDTLFAKATIAEGPRTVGLWLGAGIMLEYELGDARAFLGGKRDDRQRELAHCEHDLHFVRRQITTTEVSLARLYNWTLRKNNPK